MNAHDLHILRLLESDGRMSFSELANQVGMSKTPCWNKVKELQKQGVIQGYKAIINPLAVGLEIVAIVHVVVRFDESSAFEEAIHLHRNIVSCEAVTGDFDYVLKVFAPNIAELDQLLRKEISRIPGVARFSTAIATRTIKSDAPLSDMLSY